MSVKARLSTLRREGGMAGSTAPADAGERRLAERLQRVRHAGGGIAPSRPGDPQALARRLDGEVIAPGVILIEERLPLSLRHGDGSLKAAWPAGVPLLFPEQDRVRDRIFLDTETTGLSGGSGTAVFLLGLGRLEDGRLVLRQYLLTAFAGEAAMLRDAAEWMGPAPGFVTYNGKTFDVPLLAARSRLASVADAYSERPHLDLLHATRRAFGKRWPDCRLATLETRLLGLERDDDLPGALAPAAWMDFLRAGSAESLVRVVRHNRLDLLSLAAAWPALEAVHRDPSVFGADPAAIARWHIRQGDHEEALRLLWPMRAELATDAGMELARLLKRAGRWGEARAVWEDLAARGEIVAWEALAKYHEHVARDAHTALACARALPATVDHLRRRRRLESKLGNLSLF